MLKLRLRSSSGQSTLELESNATLGALKAAIHTSTGLKPSLQELRSGFPPKQIPAVPSSTLLSSLGIASGELIVVDELDEAEAESPAGSVASAATATSTPRSNKRSASPSNHHSRPAPAPPTSGISALSINNPSSNGSSTPAPDYVEVNGGYLVQRVVPDDNSCLFTAISLVCLPSANLNESIPELRKTVARAIEKDPATWNEAVLGRSAASYIATIQQKSSWGGAIELSILAEHFSVEVCSIDVQSGRVDRFGQGRGFSSQVFVVYSGIHYDAITFAYEKPRKAEVFPPPNLEFDTTVFDVEGAEEIESAALLLVATLRKRHAYTDAANFTLQCDDCGKALVGEVEARQHARESGHNKFGEYDQ